MPIHTEAPDEPTYARIINSPGNVDYTGSVGIVLSTGKVKVTSGEVEMAFMDVVGAGNKLVFDVNDIEYITKKEYFIGALGG